MYIYYIYHCDDVVKATPIRSQNIVAYSGRPANNFWLGADAEPKTYAPERVEIVMGDKVISLKDGGFEA